MHNTTTNKLQKNKLSTNKLSGTMTSLGIRADTIDVAILPQHKKPAQVRDEIPTLNQYGYMKFELEEFSNDFINLAAKAQTPVLEIGPAYGFVARQVLDTGATIVALDIGREHLEVLASEAPAASLDRLYLYHAAFPNAVDFPPASFEVIYMARILHFLTGEEIEQGLAKLSKWLSKDGKLIATNCSIYHSSVKGKMQDIFTQRINNQEAWAGMTNKDGFDVVHNDFSPEFLNAFYKEQLLELLPKYGFEVEKIKYFDYPNDPWPDQGIGHVGFVATKM